MFNRFYNFSKINANDLNINITLRYIKIERRFTVQFTQKS